MKNDAEPSLKQQCLVTTTTTVHTHTESASDFALAVIIGFIGQLTLLLVLPFP